MSKTLDRTINLIEALETINDSNPENKKLLENVRKLTHFYEMIKHEY